MPTKSSMDLVEDAKGQIENLSPGDVQREMAAGDGTPIVCVKAKSCSKMAKSKDRSMLPRGRRILRRCALSRL